MAACLWGDVAAVTLPPNKRCTSSSVTLKNTHPLITYTPAALNHETMFSSDCAQPSLSLCSAERERHCVSPLFCPSLTGFHIWKYKVPVSGNLMIKEMCSEEEVCVCVREGERDRERNVSGCHCQIPTVPLNGPPSSSLSLSHTHTHTQWGSALCVLFCLVSLCTEAQKRLMSNKCVCSVLYCTRE